MSDIKVLTLVGSLRAASVNRQIAGLAAARAPAGIEVNLYRGLRGGPGELPLYNEDIDNARRPTRLGERAARRDDVMVFFGEIDRASSSFGGGRLASPVEVQP